ncbi:zinc finger X-chromosomal protein [Folsomia candida]|uniref:Zinc finger protein 40 n=1 Tax=Folsomia candida TaxID=158441 RepID=A0A226E3P1_FOLCA|nr:zinc finger X-chromosomal protein [Folsomia candida]OXA52213.1 Zinc finger protein 40 [Folsomia candida]
MSVTLTNCLVNLVMSFSELEEVIELKFGEIEKNVKSIVIRVERVGSDRSSEELPKVDRLVEKAKKLVLETNTAMCELHDVELDSTSKRIKTRDKLAKDFGEILVGYRETMWSVLKKKKSLMSTNSDQPPRRQLLLDDVPDGTSVYVIEKIDDQYTVYAKQKTELLEMNGVELNRVLIQVYRDALFRPRELTYGESSLQDKFLWAKTAIRLTNNRSKDNGVTGGSCSYLDKWTIPLFADPIEVIDPSLFGASFKSAGALKNYTRDYKEAKCSIKPKTVKKLLSRHWDVINYAINSATDNVIDVVEKEDEVCLALGEPEKKKRKFRGTTGRLGCDFCDYRCDKPSVMIIHVRTHTAEKPFVCETCHVGFSDKSTLSRHINNGCTFKGKGRKVGFKQIEKNRQVVVLPSAPNEGSTANTEVAELRNEIVTLKSNLQKKDETIILLNQKIAGLEKKLTKTHPFSNVQPSNAMQHIIPFPLKRTSQTDNPKSNKKSSTGNDNNH